ncbi:MAG: hypothetical protein ABMA64_35360 [Myxococcota bacterium]
MWWTAFAGCETPPYDRGEWPVWSAFPFDGEREWVYRSTDDALPYLLVARSSGEGEVVDGGLAYTVRYETDCVTYSDTCTTGDVLASLTWSSDASAGVRVHAIDDVPLDPPVALAADDATEGDALVTESGGRSWTSTFAGVSSCPIAMAASWPSCVQLEVAVDAGDGGVLAGTWWAADRSGVAGFTPSLADGRWELTDSTCAGECDGTW